MTELEFEFQKAKQIVELKGGQRMSPGEAIIAKAVFYYCKEKEQQNNLKGTK